MTLKSMKLAIAMGLCGLTATAAAAPHGVESQAGRVWQALYQRGNANPKHASIALRLEVKGGSGNALTGTLTQYKSVVAKKYSAKTVTPLTMGAIIKNPGGGHNQTRQDFWLSNSSGTITVKGFFYTGKNRSPTIGRDDDRLCIRVIFTTMKPVQAPMWRDCDSDPPDEDVLLEEDAGEGDPDYVADDPPPP
jgi:hypothetical protein